MGRKLIVFLAAAAITTMSAVAQTTPPAAEPAPQSSTTTTTTTTTIQNQQNSNNQVEPMDQTPTFKVNVVERTTQAVDYRDRGGSTEVALRGTEMMPSVTGDVKEIGRASCRERV